MRSNTHGHDTSGRWFRYDDTTIYAARRALDRSFRAFKLKLGWSDGGRDPRRAGMLRELVGPDALMMLDVNQQWTFPEATEMRRAPRQVSLYWIEEPTHPDEVHAHSVLAKAVAPLRIAIGEYAPNRVVFDNFIHVGAVHCVQANCMRLAGISEFLAVSPLARARGLPLICHVGGMGQIHQRMVVPDLLSFTHAGREERS